MCSREEVREEITNALKENNLSRDEKLFKLKEDMLEHTKKLLVHNTPSEITLGEIAEIKAGCSNHSIAMANVEKKIDILSTKLSEREKGEQEYKALIKEKYIDGIRLIEENKKQFQELSCQVEKITTELSEHREAGRHQNKKVEDKLDDISKQMVGLLALKSEADAVRTTLTMNGKGGAILAKTIGTLAVIIAGLTAFLKWIRG